MNQSLNVKEIHRGLGTGSSFSEVFVFDTVTSTNDVAWQYATQGGKSVAVFAEHQSAGRGRRNSSWVSDSGAGILCSVLLSDLGLGSDMITLLGGIAIAETLRFSCNLNARIKWPNDVFVNSMKIAGVLTEARQVNNCDCVVLGFGLNYLPAGEVSQPVTSVTEQSRVLIDRNTLAVELLKKISLWISIALNRPDEIIAKFSSLSLALGRRITVINNNQSFTGNCIGIDPVEGLILQLEGGGVRMFHASQSSILKGSLL